MKLYLPLLLYLLTVLFSCQQGDHQELQALEDKMMAIHDEVMPQWMELSTVADKLKVIIDKPTVPGERRVDITAAIDRLEAAHDGMRDWMNNIQRLDQMSDHSTEEIQAYFMAQTEKIEQVSSDMKSSLENGKKLLEEFKTES